MTTSALSSRSAATRRYRGSTLSLDTKPIGEPLRFVRDPLPPLEPEKKDPVPETIHLTLGQPAVKVEDVGTFQMVQKINKPPFLAVNGKPVSLRHLEHDIGNGWTACVQLLHVGSQIDVSFKKTGS